MSWLCRFWKELRTGEMEHRRREWDRRLSTGQVRLPNEVWISTELLEQMLAEGEEVHPPIRVVKGPTSKAKIIGTRMVYLGDGNRMVALVYDRLVDDPVMQALDVWPFRPRETESSPGWWEYV